MCSYAISIVRMYSTYNKYSIVFKAVPFGPMGPWRPRSTSHYFSSLWSQVLMEWSYSGSCVRCVRYVWLEGCFFDLRLLLLCIGVWPCRTVYVYMLKWVWRLGGTGFVCSFNMYVCVCGDAEVSYRNWGDCSYVGTVYVVMLKWVIGIGGTDM